MLDFNTLMQHCAPTVAPQTMAAIVSVESNHHPYAIGVQGGRLVRQPKTKAEAIATTRALRDAGWNFSVGIAQINRYNLTKHALSDTQAFEPCTNVRTGAKILEDCYRRARARMPDPQRALRAALSCYYSGNFTRGFRPDKAGSPSYVQKVLASAQSPVQAIPVVPAIQETPAPAAAQTPADNTPVLLRTMPSERKNAGGSEDGITEDSDGPASYRATIVF